MDDCEQHDLIDSLHDIALQEVRKIDPAIIIDLHAKLLGIPAQYSRYDL
jgi:hypothetical protein